MNKIRKSTTLKHLLEGVTPEERSVISDRMSLAAKIADAIEQKGLTQKEFAEVMGKRPSEISKWLSGTHNFTAETLSKIGSTLSINLLDIKPCKNKTPLKTTYLEKAYR